MNKVTPLQGDNSAISLIEIPKRVKKESKVPTGPPKVCKICLEQEITNMEERILFSENSLLDEQLIVPCECSGSMGYVHQKCIRTWIEKQITEFQQKKAFCQICRSPIFFGMKNISQCDCRLKNITLISGCNVISSIVEVILLFIVIVIYRYSQDIYTNSILRYTLIALIGILGISFALTIMVIISEACFKKSKFIGRIYSLEESQHLGLRQPRKHSDKQMPMTLKQRKRRKLRNRDHTTPSVLHPIYNANE